MKKFLLLLCSLGLLISTAACGSDNDTDRDSGSAVSETTAATTETKKTTEAKTKVTTKAKTEAVTERKTEAPTEPKTEAKPTENINAEIPKTEQKLVFEKDGFSIHFMGLGSDTTILNGKHDYYTIIMKIENNSDSDVTISYHDLNANGESIMDSGFLQAPKGKNFEKIFYLEDFDVTKTSVDNFSFVIDAWKDEFAENGQPIGTPEVFFENEMIDVVL